mmetsp:Transcript_140632/g.244882  ORF Transcript_140632/g.244882 Transcript_140632/m.244882 type:complete len:211 (-) Transcript_140632:2-634(-)
MPLRKDRAGIDCPWKVCSWPLDRSWVLRCSENRRRRRTSRTAPTMQKQTAHPRMGPRQKYQMTGLLNSRMRRTSKGVMMLGMGRNCRMERNSVKWSHVQRTSAGVEPSSTVQPLVDHWPADVAFAWARSNHSHARLGVSSKPGLEGMRASRSSSAVTARERVIAPETLATAMWVHSTSGESPATDAGARRPCSTADTTGLAPTTPGLDAP